MRMGRYCAIIGMFAFVAIAQNITTPVFVLKDGDATAFNHSGAANDIQVGGNGQQSMGWITFQMQGIDVSKIGAAKLVLFVKTLTNPGKLQVRCLTSDITLPENKVRLADIPFDNAVAATKPLGAADVETAIQIDLTTAVKSGTFKGVALTAEDRLTATFDSKEGDLVPLLLLTNNVNDVASAWISGTKPPIASIGKDGDYYLNSTSGDVSSKVAGAWTIVTNIIGPVGLKGDKGDQGPQGLTGATGAKGDKGDTGSQGLTGPMGPVGPIGLTGPQGPVGPQGTKGEKGDQGIQGVPGATGSFSSGHVAGDMQYWNGANWVMVSGGTQGQSLSFCNGQPMWGPCPNTLALITADVSNITSSSATCGGNVTTDGGKSVIARGICYNTSPNPNIFYHTVASGSGTGLFTANMTGLTVSTTYYVRAYAINATDTAYGNEISFTTNAYFLGQIFGGGIIFYIDGTGKHGLIAAEQNAFDGNNTLFPWGCLGISIPGTSAALDSGQSNTTAIVNGCIDIGAARVCKYYWDLNGNYHDWYLPSKDELNLLHQNRWVFTEQTPFDGDFWCSTEASSVMAWCQNLANGKQVIYEKSTTHFARAIRSF